MDDRYDGRIESGILVDILNIVHKRRGSQEHRAAMEEV